MKKLTIKDKEYLLVRCPKDINKFVIKNYGYAGKWLEGIEDSKLNSWKVKIDNENTYQIINTISNLTEEECKEWVEYKGTTPWFKNYIKGIANLEWFEFKTAKQSFISLLKSKNILAKSFIDEPTQNNLEQTWKDYSIELNKWNKLPDELLLIQINN